MRDRKKVNPLNSVQLQNIELNEKRKENNH